MYSFLQSWEFALCWPENWRLNSKCCIRSKNCYIKHKYSPWTNARLRVKKSVITAVFFKVYIYSVFYWIQVFNEGEWNQNQERSWFGSASCGFLRCSSDVSFVNHCLSSFKEGPDFEKIEIAYYSYQWLILYRILQTRRFHLNGYTRGFRPQTQKLEPHSKWIVPCESTVGEEVLFWMVLRHHHCHHHHHHRCVIVMPKLIFNRFYSSLSRPDLL